MNMKEWIDMDIDKLELMDITDLEKARVKRHVLKKRKKSPIWRNMAVAAVLLVGATTATSFAFPSIASQIPFMENVIRYFHDETEQYKSFEAFSTNVGLAQTSNDMTVMIDHAVYDGTNVTVSFAIETAHDFGEAMQMSGTNWFNVVGATGGGGSSQFTKISDTRYAGLSTFTPHFKDDVYPEMVQVTWTPSAFYSMSNDVEVKGDWSFAFSLQRVEGDIQFVNETVQHTDVDFTLKTVEFTDVSTVIVYEQVATDELLAKWPSVTPMFRVLDDLGHVYVDGTSGGGVSYDSGKTFEGTTTFGTIQEGARQLIIQPIEIASLMSGQGHIAIELEPIVIELGK